MRKKLPRVAQLAKDLLNFRAMDIMTLAASHAALKKLTKDRYMASGVIVSISNLSGDVLVGPVLIANGLSDDAIAALQSDIKATYDDRLAMNKISA